MLADFGGPEVRTLESIAQSWLAARNEHRRLVNMPVPFQFGRQVAEGKLTCPDHKVGLITFDQYLAERYSF